MTDVTVDDRSDDIVPFRIEVPEEQITWVTGELRSVILRRFEELGFVYVTVDLAGFRSGSGNAVLDGATAANMHPNG